MTENPAPRAGDPVVDGALAEFAQHADRPLSERVAAATETHRTLQQRLADPARPDPDGQRTGA